MAGKRQIKANGRRLMIGAKQALIACCYYQLWTCPRDETSVPVDKWVIGYAPGAFLTDDGGTTKYHIPANATPTLCPGTIVTVSTTTCACPSCDLASLPTSYFLAGGQISCSCGAGQALGDRTLTKISNGVYRWASGSRVLGLVWSTTNCRWELKDECPVGLPFGSGLTDFSGVRYGCNPVGTYTWFGGCSTETRTIS